MARLATNGHDSWLQYRQLVGVAASFEERNGARGGVGLFEMTLNASRG